MFCWNLLTTFVGLTCFSFLPSGRGGLRFAQQHRGIREKTEISFKIGDCILLTQKIFSKNYSDGLALTVLLREGVK